MLYIAAVPAFLAAFVLFRPVRQLVVVLVLAVLAAHFFMQQARASEVMVSCEMSSVRGDTRLASQGWCELFSVLKEEAKVNILIQKSGGLQRGLTPFGHCLAALEHFSPDPQGIYKVTRAHLCMDAVNYGGLDLVLAPRS